MSFKNSLKMTCSKDLFKSLIGNWGIKRILGSYGTAEGIAKFTPTDDKFDNDKSEIKGDSSSSEDSIFRLKYREDVNVHYNQSFSGTAFSSSAYKEYIYEYDEKGDKIIKKFCDGRFFYELNIDWESHSANGDHLCEKDFYTAKYFFLDPSHFNLDYDVKGPHKDYLIHTEFTKINET